MLRFIRRRGTRPEYANCISIHLMLRFISTKVSFVPKLIEFQYISCYGLSGTMFVGNNEFGNFNTSHVTVYLRTHELNNLSKDRFQYISCYGLSRSVKRIQIIPLNFNTSHVTVYRGIWSNSPDTRIFQYISCYGLSKSRKNSGYGFIYFNTSHVTVYHFHP